MTTITRERLLKIQQWRETYGPGSNVVLPAEEAEELARIALALQNVEPVYQYQSEIYNEDSGETEWYWGDCDSGFYSQYAVDRRRILYTGTPVPVVPEVIPETLRDEIIDLCDGYEIGDVGAQEIWNACRATMLQLASIQEIPSGWCWRPWEPLLPESQE
ncbi:TPA: dTDP-6-deoxy-D-glucose-3,5-epimerase [Citrobacter amalonaticus]